MPWKRAWMVIVIGLLALPTLAQEIQTVQEILYDDQVEDTLTEEAFFDWWMVQAGEGDQMVIDMAAAGGLQPLIGLLDPGGELVARSTDGAANSTISLEYITPAAGQYIIVATRVGNENGTSTGSYSLRLRRANSPAQDVNPYQDVTFRCEDFEVTTVATLAFADDPQPRLLHRITVYGIDGFQSVIRLKVDQPQPYEVCNTNADQTIDDTFTLPGEAERTITADNLNTVSQLLVSGAEEAGVITITLGGKDGTPGRYMAIIEGFSIEPTDDIDVVDVRLGPLVAEKTALSLYMVAAPNSRLDPFLTLPGLDFDVACDDAGRRDCDALPSFSGAGATLHEGDGIRLYGDRSDAGLLLNPGNPDSMGIELSSRNGDTHGGYALVFIGELPPRE